MCCRLHCKRERKGIGLSMGCPGQEPDQVGGYMGALPLASRSMVRLTDSSFLGMGRWGVGCFQMSGNRSRGWYTDSSEPSSLASLHTANTQARAMCLMSGKGGRLLTAVPSAFLADNGERVQESQTCMQLSSCSACEQSFKMVDQDLNSQMSCNSSPNMRISA